MKPQDIQPVSLIKESFAIFRRNPMATTVVLLLMLAASAGQVVSLGSLYPILQVLVSDQANSGPTSGIFVRFLGAIGAAPTLTNLLVLFVILGLSYSILNWFSDTIQGWHLRNFDTALRHELFESVTRADWQYAKRLTHGEFINVITREANQYKDVVKYSLLTFGSLLQFSGIFAYALYVDWKITALGIILFAAGSLVLIPILWSANRLGRRATEVAGNMSNRLIAGLRSLKTVKALSLESFLIRTLQPSFQDSASNYFHQNMLTSGQYAIMEIIALIAISSMLYIGLNILGTPKPQLFIVLLLLFRALPPVRLGIDNYQRAYGSLASVDAVRRHLLLARDARQREGGVPVPEGWGRIEFRNVSFAYPGDRTILKNFSAQILRRQFWAIVGASGSGKTTILDLLLGLLKPQQGAIMIDDVRLDAADLSSWHSQIAYLGQEAFAFAGTLRDNLVWGTEQHFGEAELVAALRAARLDASLEKDVGENGSNLSGGEKQRLALARLFLRKPKLVILDEPTTGLDPATEKDIFDSILTSFQDTTFIVVTHREELTHGADHIVRIENI